MGVAEYLLPNTFKCTKCPLSGQGEFRRHVRGYGNPDSRVVVVDVGPGAEEHASGHPFVDKAALKFWELAALKGLTQNDLFVTYFTKCANFDGEFKEPGKGPFEECREWLDEELKKHGKFEVLLLLGAPTSKAFFKPLYTKAEMDDFSFTGQCGVLRDFEYLGMKFKLILAPRPGQIIREMKYAGSGAAEGQLTRAFELIKDYITPNKGITIPGRSYDYKLITNFAEWSTFKKEALASNKIACDIETTGFMPHKLKNGKGAKELLCVGFSLAENTGRCLMLHPKYRHFEVGKHLQMCMELIDFFKEVKGVTFHNGNFDMAFMRWGGIKVRNCDWDTMLAQHLINENYAKGLDALAAHLRSDLGNYWGDIEKYLDKGDDGNGYLSAPEQELGIYCMKDCDVAFTARLQQEITFAKPEFAKRKRIFDFIVMPLLYWLVEAQNTGIYVDQKKMEEIESDLLLRLELCEQEIQKVVPEGTNLKSPQQLAAFLFGHVPPDSKNTEKLQKIANAGPRLSPPILTKEGSPSTNEEALEILESQNTNLPVFKHFLQFRHIQKQLSTYIGGQISYDDKGKEKKSKGKGARSSMDEKDRVHTTFKQGATVTGRLASERPNMQNIPRDKSIRSMYMPAPGFKWVGGDFSQAELRIMAIESKDKGLYEAFASGADIHAAVAAQLFHKTLAEVDKEKGEFRELREVAKTINFGLIYGKQAMSLGEQLKISTEEAQAFIDQYFNRFYNVDRWMKDTKQFAHDNLYVENIFGRRRNFLESEIRNPKRRIQEEAFRQAINSPIQSAAADCTGIVTIRACKEIEKRGLKSKFVLTVHDEVWWEAPEAEADEVQKILTEAAEKPIKGIDDVIVDGISVHMKMDIKVVTNWAEK